MIWWLFVLVGGVALLLTSARFLVSGVSALARAAGVSALVVGLTVVAFGTSTPEVVINTFAAWRGDTGLAFGNIVGSCAINIGFTLGLAGLICPLAVRPSIITREIPLLQLTVAAFAVMSLDGRINGSGENVISRSDGMILLLIFGVFVYSILTQALEKQAADAFVADVVAAEDQAAEKSPWTSLLKTLAGLLGVAVGGRMVVIGASSLAAGLGVPDVLIGLTIVSFGTTLPELITSVVAARRGQSDLALGNIIGSNLFNLLFIGGLASCITPLPIPIGGERDLLLMALLTVALLPIAMRQRRITRGEALVLVTVYLAFTGWRGFTSSGAGR
ncbi:MAG: calcium/sodium antiporter [Phycisphaerae bacterium]|nr:calcium/sodium antiporter [Phycisphaerae bacterium]MDW8261909.1 calcium/sodium antiporter [Phycisphaerales bacterium]